MQLQENTLVYFQHFADDCVTELREFPGILDSPGQVVLDGNLIATDYTITARTEDTLGLGYGDTLSCKGFDFWIRSIEPQEDGAIALIFLSRTMLQPSSVSREFTFNTPSTLWVINHDLPYYPRVRLFDGTGEEFQSEIDYPTPTRIEISFNVATSGVARIY